MDERYYKALNKEEMNKLSAEEHLDKYLAEFEEEAIPMERYGLLHFSESFASMRVEQEKESIRQFLISEGFEMLAEKI